MKEKVILAYSGGLDTTVLIPWLKENYDYEVICVCIDVGQGNELDGLEERAKYCGASKLYIEHATDEFCDEYIAPCLMANASYENKYLLGTAMARPLMAKILVDIAKKEGAVAICHGATGKGIQSREEELEYCAAHHIDLPFKADNSYSRDRNIWHISHEGLELEDPAQAPNFDHMLVLGVTPEKAPDEDVEISITFEAGKPVALNGEKMKFSALLEKLNELGGKHGIGITDIVENRMVGMKSRGVYETPGGTILMEAHKQLEELILDKETLKYKKNVDNEFADVVYSAKWFSPLREALQAFVESTQKYVTGECKMKLYKGNIIKQGTTSPYSLYNESIASFTTGDLYDHHDATGFINLYGLSTKVRAMKMAEAEKEQ